MKAWRKHNMKQATTIQNLEGKIARALRYADYPEDFEDLRAMELKVKKAKGLMLRTKVERRGQFAAEVANPSFTLYAIMANAGLPTPPEFLEAVKSANRTRIQSNNPISS